MFGKRAAFALVIALLAFAVPVSVTLLSGAMSVPVDTYAQSYLAGHGVASVRDEDRQGVRGRSWVFAVTSARFE